MQFARQSGAFGGAGVAQGLSGFAFGKLADQARLLGPVRARDLGGADQRGERSDGEKELQQPQRRAQLVRCRGGELAPAGDGGPFGDNGDDQGGSGGAGRFLRPRSGSNCSRVQRARSAQGPE